MSKGVDLSQLAVARDGPAPAGASPPPGASGGWLARLVLPGLLLLGFGCLVAYAMREALSPPRAVTVMPVVVWRGGVDAPPDTPLFRAAGWIEPRPTPTVVTALAEGVVERLLVVEGQKVKKGQAVARLVEADARLALESAEADVELRESEVASARAALVAARARHESPAHLRADQAEAEAALARAESEAATLPGALAAAKARLGFAERSYKAKAEAGSAVPVASVERAESDRDAASAAVGQLLARQKRLPAELAALKARRDARRQLLEGRVEEARRAAECQAAVKGVLARLRGARAARDAAKLRLDRTAVRAPASGRVLALVARPGSRLAGLAPGTFQDASTVMTLYDPASLQVRVDVRLDDVGKVRPGQKARIETAALPGAVLDGEVLLATSQADIQKNTLAVKVAVKAPPPGLRPEMLCQVTFLAPPRTPGAPGKGGEGVRLMVPRQLVEDGRVWVVDQLAGTARRREVQTGLSSGELVEVVSGLSPQDRLIVGGREGLSDGARVRVAGEDESLGVGGPAGGRGQ
jgi:RND family efflux transporter MFP subunit